MKVWFHRGSTDFFTVFVLRLLLSLSGEMGTINKRTCLDKPSQVQTIKRQVLVHTSLILPSVWQEVDLDVGVSGSAVILDRKFFGSENRDNQLMTDFVVPQLHLCNTHFQ